MTTRTIVRGIGTLIFISAALLCQGDTRAEPTQPNAEDSNLRAGIPRHPKKSLVHLYFADRDNEYLMSEQRVLLHADDPASFAKAIIQSLIKGPQKGLIRTIPVGTELREIYVTPDNVCYIDLGQSIQTNHPGGSHSELLTIYSMVNSLILNVPEIEQVKILIEGNEALTLAGHIDLQLTVQANMLLIR
jgi:spore germination protein GerM